MSEKQDSKDEVVLRTMMQKLETTDDSNLNINEQTINEQSMSKVKHSSSMNIIQERKKIMSIDDNYIVNDFPGTNVPEKIVFIVDTGKETECTQFETRASNKFSPLYMIKRVIEIFINIKLGINKKHEFALMTLDANGASWICNFTNNRKIILSILETIEEVQIDDEENLYDLGPCFETISMRMNFEEDYRSSSFVHRVILLYARSCSIPQFLTGRHYFEDLMEGKNFFLDSLYVHEPLSDDNDCQDVYTKLSSLDIKQTSYILEVGRNPATLHTNMAKLIAHPLQRVRQDDSPYSYCNPLSPQEVQSNV